MSDDKHPFDAAAILELLDDRIEEGGNHPFDLLARQIGMVVAQLLDKLGTDHGIPPQVNGRHRRIEAYPPAATADPS